MMEHMKTWLLLLWSALHYHYITLTLHPVFNNYSADDSNIQMGFHVVDKFSMA